MLPSPSVLSGRLVNDIAASIGKRRVGVWCRLAGLKLSVAVAGDGDGYGNGRWMDLGIIERSIRGRAMPEIAPRPALSANRDH